MDFKTALKIMIHHQEWRQGKRDDWAYTPQKLTEATDILIKLARKQIRGQSRKAAEEIKATEQQNRKAAEDNEDAIFT